MTEKSANYIIDLIQLARDHEELLQHLYEAFGEKIPENRDFWLGVASVEAKHVRMMETLQEHARQNLLRMRPDSLLTQEDVQGAVDHLKLYLEEVRSRGITARRAAAVAKEIEEGILEKDFDQQFLVEHDEAEELLHRICEETRGHSAAMDALIARHDEFSTLVHSKAASQVQIELARTLAAKEGMAVDEVLIQRFEIPRDAILDSFSRYYRIPVLENPTEPSLPEELIHPLRDRYEDMKTRLYAPVQQDGGRLLVALAKPSDIPLRDEIALLYPKHTIELRVGLSNDILTIIDQLFGHDAGKTQASAAELLDALERQTAEEEKAEELAQPVTEDDSALVKLVNLIIEDAYQKGASDIHIEPFPEEDTRVRIRVDGVLYPLMGAPARYSRALISRVKIMAGLDISERRKPQSGKIKYRRWGRVDTELRVEVYPSGQNQEDAVLRILASGTPLPLQGMGFTEANLTGIQHVLQKPYGLLLCVGPTGSGKTTTLHSLLGHINTAERKILTVEDPIEITQRGMRQVQVNRKAEMTFATALRSFLRADPDVIMVGEMRDFETARTALEASLTGHLVFSTLHTNTAPETVTRLLDMGLDPFAFGDALLGVLAQRLARRFCDDCRQPYAEPTRLMAQLAEEYGDEAGFRLLCETCAPDLKAPGGCDECNGIGYRGRLAIHEFLTVDDGMSELIMRKAPAGEIRKHAMAGGMRTLRQDGIGKVLRGATALDEIHRVCAR